MNIPRFPFSPWFNSIGLVNLLDIFRQSTAETYDASDETFVAMLAADINDARCTIKIVESEDNMYLYDDARVVDALERAIERGVKIQFVLKPCIGEIE